MEISRENIESSVDEQLDSLVEGDFYYIHLVREDISESDVSTREEIALEQVESVKQACFRCARENLNKYKSWMPCADNGCLAVVCPLCVRYLDSIKKNTPCFVCGKRYIGGPRRQFSKCSVCFSWKCQDCPDMCRHVIQSAWSQHDFVRQ